MTLYRVVIKNILTGEVIKSFEPDSFHMCEMVKNGVDINLNKEEFVSSIVAVEAKHNPAPSVKPLLAPLISLTSNPYALE